MGHPYLSIIIPTLNEEKYLPKLLESIKTQDFKDYEIIVVDNISEDNTIKIAKAYNCKIITNTKRIVSSSRNMGVKNSKGSLLLFLDADSLLPKDFLKETIAEFKKRKLATATVSIIPLSDKFIDKALYLIYNLWQRIIQFVDPHASGSCIFSTKKVFERIDGFDETITFAEDHNFVRKSKKYGKFRVLKSTKIYNDARRLNKEGRLKLIGKMLFALFQRTFIGEIRHKKFIWEPGDIKKD